MLVECCECILGIELVLGKFCERNPFELNIFFQMENGQKIITLAISKCYGKVRVLDNSLVLARNSRSSSFRGVGVRCLLFNSEGSCSNPCLCANFFHKYSGAECFHFFDTMRLPPFRLCETFFRKFFNVPKESSLHFVRYFATERMLKNPKGSLFQIFLHYETVKISHFFEFF